ncbi:MAG TPA: ABC transporter permease [Nocardioides sp.]|nr:ABC transporter permease [Nocardioides sp.]
MSVPDTGLAPIAAPPPVRRRIPAWWWAVGLVAVLALLSLLEMLTGANDLTSSGTIRATLIATTPILLAALGGLWSERAGVVNIGLEGMMILGTFGAAWWAYEYGAWVGVVGAIIFGCLGGALHAIATVLFGVDHIVSGVAINIIALGATQYLAAITFTGLKGGGPTQSPPLPNLPALTIDPLADSLGDLEDKDIFLVSEIAALLRALVNDLSIMVVIALLLVFVTWFLLWRTPFGLRLRSCGESPVAAETLGVNVLRYKFVAVLISGGLAGLGGCFLAMVASSSFRDGQTGNRGYIGLAAMIFGNWRPGGALAGSGLFGYTETLGLRQGGDSVHALLLAIAAIALAIGAWQLRSGSRVALVVGLAVVAAGLPLAYVFGDALGDGFDNQGWVVLAVTVAAAVLLVLLRRHEHFAAVVLLLVGLAFAVLYFSIDEVPGDFTRMTPYLVTLLVLAFAAQRLRMPAADGQIYRKGSAG